MLVTALISTAGKLDFLILATVFPPINIRKVSFQYFGHLMRRADSFEKTLILGKTEGGRRRINRE